MTFCGLIAYEVLSASESHRIDVWDLAATVVFTLLSTAVYYGILVPKPEPLDPKIKQEKQPS